MLPVGSTLRIPVSKNAYEHVSATRTMFRPLTFQAWEVPASATKLALAGELAPHAAPNATGHRPWSGTITIPRLELP